MSESSASTNARPSARRRADRQRVNSSIVMTPAATANEFNFFIRFPKTFFFLENFYHFLSPFTISFLSLRNFQEITLSRRVLSLLLFQKEVDTLQQAVTILDASLSTVTVQLP